MARGKAVSIVLSDEERLDLESRVRRRKSSHGTARRARIVLLAAEGLSNTAIAEKLGVSRLTVGTWRRRFAERRLEGLDDEPRPGAPRKIGDDKIVEVVTRTLEDSAAGRDPLEPPFDGPGHGPVSDDGAPHLGRLRPAAASGRELQAVERP